MRLDNWSKQTQFKPNLRKAKMNVSLYIIEDYRKKDDFAVQKNKPNSNPIPERPKMNANVFVTKDYENEATLMPQKNKANQSQFKKSQNEYKLNYNKGLQKNR